MSSLDEKPIPPGALIGAALLMAVTIAGVGAVQLNRHFHPQPAVNFETASASAMQSRLLRFVDSADGVSIYGGHVRVFDATTEQELPQLGDREGFVRAVLNAMAYERSKRGVSALPVFRLTQWSNGAVTIEDPATGAHINLGSFGDGNKAAFLRFFHSKNALS